MAKLNNQRVYIYIRIQRVLCSCLFCPFEDYLQEVATLRDQVRIRALVHQENLSDNELKALIL